MISFDIEPAGPSLEAIQLRGLKHEHLSDPAVKDELNRLWVKHGIIIFRDMEDSDALHLDLSRVFGPFQVHPIKQSNTAPDHLELTNVQY